MIRRMEPTSYWQDSRENEEETLPRDVVAIALDTSSGEGIYYRRPAPPQRVPRLSELPEEMANTLTHGFGVLISLLASVALMATIFARGTVGQMIGCGVYCLSLIGVYAMSTMSHAIQQPERKRLYRMLDQGVIYLLIAGTYTPIVVSYMPPIAWCWVVFSLMWTVAISGFVSKVFWAHRIEKVAIYIYVLLGWVPVSISYPMVSVMPAELFAGMFLGGVFYTVGTYFLLNDHKRPFNHAIWHILVIAGSASHFAAIYLYIAL